MPPVGEGGGDQMFREKLEFDCNQEMDDLKQLTDPLVNYLREKHHPHTAIVVTDTRAVLTDDAIMAPSSCGRSVQEIAKDMIAESRNRLRAEQELHFLMVELLSAFNHTEKSQNE